MKLVVIWLAVLTIWVCIQTNYCVAYHDVCKSNHGGHIRRFGGLYYPDDRPQGHWIRQDKYFQAFNETVTTYKCSVCGHEPYFGGDISKFNYCPNCGARMENKK